MQIRIAMQGNAYYASMGKCSAQNILLEINVVRIRR